MKALAISLGQFNAGGDMIELVARFRAIGVAQAAKEVARHFAIDFARTNKEGERDEVIASPGGLLWPRHEMVQALGCKSARGFDADRHHKSLI